MNPKVEYWLLSSVLWSIVVSVFALIQYDDFNTFFVFYLGYLVGVSGVLLSSPKWGNRKSNSVSYEKPSKKENNR